MGENEMRQLRDVFEIEADQERAYFDAKAESDAAVTAARAAGHTWAEIEAAVGTPARTLQYRASAGLTQDSKEEQKPSRAGERQHAADLAMPGTVTVEEARRRLGYKSRNSIYRLIETGELRAIDDPGTRRTRVLESSLAKRQSETRDRIVENLERQAYVEANPVHTITAAAERLGVSRATVDAMLEDGRLTGQLNFSTGATGVTGGSLDRMKAALDSSVTISAAAEALATSRPRIRRMVADGRLSGVEVGGQTRVTLGSIEREARLTERREDPSLLTDAEAAQELEVSRQTVANAVKREQLARDADTGLITRESVDRWKSIVANR